MIYYIYRKTTNLSQQLIVGVSLFVLAVIMSKNCTCLVSISDDLDENVKTAAMLTAMVDIADISVCSELSNKTDFHVSYRPSCFLCGLLI